MGREGGREGGRRGGGREREREREGGREREYDQPAGGTKHMGYVLVVYT